MAFPERFIDELTARTDIVELIGRYVPLQRRGGAYVARCPFHNEKTPSFNVSPERGLFYCFGCHAGGGVIGFVERVENLSYPEAVRFLSSRAGMEVPEDESEQVFRVRRERLAEINRMAARWFHGNLSLPDGRAAVEYMQKRGIKPGFARKFGLGCAPDSWDGLLRELTDRGVSREEMSVAGLITAGRRGSMYDSFRNRLMFPIFDIRGQVAAFSGRALDDSPMKYKNSPETPLYSKRATLYAAHAAKSSGRGFWILAEGNMDAFMLHQAGFDCAVATCGTALTPAQANLMSRYVKECVLCYDSDAAGQSATQKAVAVLDGAGLRVRVLSLEGAKDPDEFILKYGAAAFESLLSGAENHVDYRLRAIAGQHDLSSEAGRVGFLRAAEAMISALPGNAEREVYAGKAAKAAGVEPKSVLSDIGAIRQKKAKKEESALKYELLRPPRDSFDRSEELALSLLLARPELLDGCPLTAEDFSEGALREIFEALPRGGARLNAGLDRKTEEILARFLMDNGTPPGGGAAAALADCAERMMMKSEGRRAAAEGKDELEAKYERLKGKKRFGE